MRTERRIGLLWDSASNNVGDQAIGWVVQRILAAHQIPARVVDPFTPELDDVAMLVIGGGELIRTPGDPFYDVFRVPGRHVLNTVGVTDGAATSYLDNYALVTVRSVADRERLGRGEVCPCLTMLYQDYLPEAETPAVPDGAVGIHLNMWMQTHVAELVMWLKRSDVGPIVWIPFTNYISDYGLLRRLQEHVPGSMVLPPMTPDQVFRVVGRLQAFVCSSLHATIFAYTQGIPFLSYSYHVPPKIMHFLAERQLADRVVCDANDVQRLLPQLLDSPPDTAEQRATDRLRCQEYVSRVVEQAHLALSEQREFAPIYLTPAHRMTHQKAEELTAAWGDYAGHMIEAMLNMREQIEQAHLIESPVDLTAPAQLSLEPHTTGGWQRLRQQIQFRGHRLRQLYTMSRFVLEHDGLGVLLDRSVRWLRGERRYFTGEDDLYTPAPSPGHFEARRLNVAEPRILYIACADEQLSSRRYRVHNVQEQMQKLGVPLDIISEADVLSAVRRVVQYDIVVLARVAVTAGVKKLVDRATNHHIAVVFEIDDYVFDKQAAPYIHALNDLVGSERALYLDGMQRYREMLLLCEYFVGTTQYLADRAAEHGLKSYVIRNGLNDRQLELAEAALQARRRHTEMISIGYLSGSPTHQADFMLVVPALVQIFTEFSQIKLVIRGYLNLPDALLPFQLRIEMLPYISWEDLVGATAQIDINLAPLEVNPFTEAKSALKYFEAAVVEVPTVASPVEDYQVAIRHGENGFLAATEQEWYACLRELITDSERRRRIGQCARQDALARYTSNMQSRRTRQVFRTIWRDKQQRR